MLRRQWSGLTVSPQDYRVLIVDDDPICRTIIGSCLTQSGFNVIEAEQGEEAFAILCRRGADLMITDWNMPVMDGLTLCRRIRANPELGFFYVIMLTANCSQEDLLKGLDAGADEFLRKPVDSQELLARVQVGFRFLAMQAALEHRNSEICRTASELARANKQLASLARNDGLTGLLNRQSWFKLFDSAWALSDPASDPLCCIEIDVDHFKCVNDTHGHDAGDRVLVAIAEAIKRSCRGSDALARLGGEEFVVLCPHTRLTEAVEVAERIRRTVAAVTLPVGNTEIRPTCSLGVAYREEGMMRPESLLKAADDMLYVAKAEGRNRVVSDHSARAGIKPSATPALLID
jgi:diguanylate cyclase (GGDEF)-like protein